VLEEDGRLLRGTFDQHLAIGKNVSRASKVLRQIQRQDQVDWWLMCASTCFFVLVLVYVLLPRVPGLVTLAGMSGRISRNAFGRSGLEANQTSALLPERKPELTMGDVAYQTLGSVKNSERLTNNLDEHPGSDLSASNVATVEVSNAGEVLDAGREVLGKFVIDGPVLRSDDAAQHESIAEDVAVEVGVTGQVAETSGDNWGTSDIVDSERVHERIRSDSTIEALDESEHASRGNDFAFSSTSEAVDTDIIAEAEGAPSSPPEINQESIVEEISRDYSPITYTSTEDRGRP